MPKNKPNKGLLKRIRLTKSGRVKIGRAFGRHLRSHKSGKVRRNYRKPTYAKSADMGRIRSMCMLKLPRQPKENTAESGSEN